MADWPPVHFTSTVKKLKEVPLSVKVLGALNASGNHTQLSLFLWEHENIAHYVRKAEVHPLVAVGT